MNGFQRQLADSIVGLPKDSDDIQTLVITLLAGFERLDNLYVYMRQTFHRLENLDFPSSRQPQKLLHLEDELVKAHSLFSKAEEKVLNVFHNAKTIRAGAAKNKFKGANSALKSCVSDIDSAITQAEKALSVEIQKLTPASRDRKALLKSITGGLVTLTLGLVTLYEWHAEKVGDLEALYTTRYNLVVKSADALSDPKNSEDVRTQAKDTIIHAVEGYDKSSDADKRESWDQIVETLNKHRFFPLKNIPDFTKATNNIDAAMGDVRTNPPTKPEDWIPLLRSFAITNGVFDTKQIFLSKGLEPTNISGHKDPNGL